MSCHSRRSCTAREVGAHPAGGRRGHIFRKNTFCTGATLFNDEHSALQPHVIFPGPQSLSPSVDLKKQRQMSSDIILFYVLITMARNPTGSQSACTL